MTEGRLLWLLVDGLSLPLFRQLAPRMLSCARALPLRPLAPNCQTPPSLFSIWSGLPTAVHQLTGYDMPVQGHASPLAMRDAFSSWPKDVSMVWDDWAAHGGRVRTCAVPFVQPQRLGSALLSHSQVYTPPLAPPQVLRHGEELVVASLQVRWRVEATNTGMRVMDTPEGEVALTFDRTHHLRLPDTVPASVAGGTHRAIAVRAVRVNGEPCLCTLGFQPVHIDGEDAPRRAAAFLHRAYAALNPARLYADGHLGQRLDGGGTGEAEALLLDLLGVVHESFLEDIRWTLEAEGGELVVAYYPVIDLLSHQLLRQAVLPATPAETALSAMVLARVAGWLGDLMSACQRRLGPGSRLVAHADHGMMPIHHEMGINRWLQQQGWLVADETAAIDPDRSLAFYHPAENGWLALHPERMAAAGLDVDMLLQALSESVGRLLSDAPPGVACAAASSLAMRPTFPACRLIKGPEVRTGEGWRSAWYVQPPDGLRLRADVRLPLFAPARKGGDHTCWSPSPWLEAALLEPEATAPEWRTPVALTDLAPTLLAWLRQRHPGARQDATTSTTSQATPCL